MAAEVIKCLLITTGTNTTGRKPSAAGPGASGCGPPQNSQNWSVKAENAFVKAVMPCIARSEKNDDPAVFFCSSIVCLLAGDPNYPAGSLIWLL